VGCYTAPASEPQRSAWDTPEKGPRLTVLARRAAGAMAPALRWGLGALLLAGLICFPTLIVPRVAVAIGPNAVLYPAGWDANPVHRGDDTYNQIISLPFSMNWMGTTYNQLYLNMNGNVTFGTSFTTYTPTTPLASTGKAIMAPFWADVDTSATGSGLCYYSNLATGSVPAVNGHPAVLVTWSNVMYYTATESQTTTDTFQLVLIDRSDTGPGNFDFMFNYDKVVWDLGTASGSQHARAGWATTSTLSYELPGSGSTTSTPFLDSGPASTSLIQNSLNSGGQLGRYVWQVRNGTAPNAPPRVSVTDRTLEGNVLNGYKGYSASADATATDADGSIVSFTSSSQPTTYPLGVTHITWTATDNDGAVATANQSVTVTDTTPPSMPTASSSTHTVGLWTSVSTVTVNSVNSTDGCAGMSGASYLWSRDATSVPDGTLDPSTTSTASGIITTTADSESFATATWPTDFVRSDTTYARLTNAAGHNHGTYAVEVWANSGTRRTVNFYRDYDLSRYETATLSFWDFVSTLSTGDYARVEYSINGGSSYAQLQNLTAGSAWTQRTYSLPVGGIVRVRFSASVNATTEYADWDDIMVQGFVTSYWSSLSAGSTSVLGDGSWYYNIRTVDGAGNWSGTASLGPILIDSGPPVTTDDAPPGWSRAPVTVSLTAVDAGSGVAYTRYRVNAGAVATYTAPFTISAEQTNTVQYWSVDNRGNVEATRSALVRIDSGPPTVPTGFSASVVATTMVQTTWNASTDPTSGVAYYRVYGNGSVVATSVSTNCTVTGLTPTVTYVLAVSAVDVAGNESARSNTDTETMPAAQIWLTIDPTALSLGGLDPGIVSTYTSATAVSVGGVGVFPYDLSCSCQDFSNVATSSITPTMPASLMSYKVRGSASVPLTPFSTGSQLVATGSGTVSVWIKPYVFDYTLNVPWAFAPGTYATQVTFTAVAH
jgi:hypothetical protein